MSHKKLKIILAEDEASIREILSELLIDEGHECVSATDGRDAAEKISKEPFDLLISDFRMPYMNGAELFQWCHENKKKMPVIFITANNDLFPEEKIAISDHSASLMHKPIDFNNLVRVIRDTTAGYQTLTR
jgi:DNA-binding NtrC family response regulator